MGDQLLRQKARRTALPGLAAPAWLGPEGPRPRWANQKQHSTWRWLPHLPYTEPSYLQSRTARGTKTRLESTAQAGGVLTGVWLRRGGGWMGRGAPRGWSPPGMLYQGPGWEGAALPKPHTRSWSGPQPGPDRGGCAAPVMKEALPGLADRGRPVLAKGL